MGISFSHKPIQRLTFTEFAMSTHVVRRGGFHNGHYSVIELNGVCQVLATVEPDLSGTLREETLDALKAVASVMNAEGAGGAVIHQTLFLADENSIAACRQIVREFYGQDLPASCFVLQPPCSGRRLAIEAFGLGKGREHVEIERVSDQVVITRHKGVTSVYADHAVPRTSASGVYERTICSYQHLRRLLPNAGARLDQILRTWLYLGGIVDDEGATQRYKELNRARTDVFQHVSFLEERLPEGHVGPAFPASTGIGTRGRSVTISALAVLSDADDVVAVPLENPRQTSAFSYSSKYSPTTPKFSRGLALCRDDEATLFISGTASITHSETRHIGDVSAQTEESLENIAALISEENLARHGLAGMGTTFDGLGVVRVYIKRLEDYEKVRAVCSRRIGSIPATYVVADVCRTDLLVEIEGIAFSRHAPNGKHHAWRRREIPQIGEPQPTQHNGHRAPYCPNGCPELLFCPHAVRHDHGEGEP